MTLALATLLGCGSSVGGENVSDGNGLDSGVLEGDDTEPPVIEFTPLEGNQVSGTDVSLTATIVDDGSGVFTATLYYWNETDSPKDDKKTAFLDQGDDIWVATIRAEEQHSSGMWYYLSALDRAQNEAFSPEGGADSPYHFGYSDE